MQRSLWSRAARAMQRAIASLELDLGGETVLTEVGSGPFVVTPLIAALAGAERVFAWTADSRHGTAAANAAALSELARHLGVEARIEPAIGERPAAHLRAASLVTNLGFVRPLDEPALRLLDPARAVVPLMYEAWELRAEDLDLPFCRKQGIRVAGTWENHPAIRVFDDCGALAVKLGLEAGYEIRGNRIAVWSDDPFGEIASRAFLDFGAESVVVTTDEASVTAADPPFDFVFLCDYDETRDYLTPGGPLGSLAESVGVGIVHLYGAIDAPQLSARGWSIYPGWKGRARGMSATLAHLGAGPVIRLHAGGLRVGQCLLRGIDDPIVQPL